MNWFQLNVAGNPTDPNNYTDLGTGTPSCPTGTNKICAIQADPDGSGNPDITDSLKDDMISALHNRSSSATVQLKS
ncbi:MULTISPECIES: hypothetical protein [Sphingobacterium]|jgi:hypothetical protein|uniref:Uncharacterized protein n=1 Tax=Sphingobacterium kitahiroshimense TaxID=470446 RepID=A0ABV0C3K3_9SPHI|nr:MULTISPECIES: hypothetical protein [Sphingobacterium]MCW2260098.1 hypothetical protein [Sphingobacterium kitahiroshimense]TCR11110.1 hypothetical protein EDF67_104203 [Sphingobacterium sp. JUb78]